MRGGSMSSVARPRKKTVSMTGPPGSAPEPAASCAPSSWAISSRPVASGTPRVPLARAFDELAHRPSRGGLRQHLLGPMCLVALAPALGGVVLNHLAQSQDA